MPKIPMRNLLVVLPGIGGSVLEQNGNEVWNLSAAAGWNLLRTAGGSLDALALRDDDPARDELDDGVRAVDLIKLPRVLAGVAKTDGYRKLCRYLNAAFDLSPGNNYIEFPYDWRRDFRGPARMLGNAIRDALPRWRAESGFAEAKAVVIAHSLGGLVARYFIEVLEGWRECRGLITVGTPHRGSVKSLNALANGTRMGIDISALIRSCTSVYQLLPTYECVENGSAWKRPVDCTQIGGLDVARAKEAAAAHERIHVAVEENSKDPAYRAHYSVMAIVGSDQPTLQSAVLSGDQLSVSQDPPPQLDNLLAHGDGTVPAASAIPRELSNQFNIPNIPEQHSVIHNSDQGLEVLKHAIILAQVHGLPALKAVAPAGFDGLRPAISLSVEDTYAAGEPVSIEAALQRVPECASIEAIVFSAENSVAPMQVALQPRNDVWQAELPPLPAGTYRITVRCKLPGPAAPPPVHDVFGVMPAM